MPLMAGLFSLPDFFDGVCADSEKFVHGGVMRVSLRDRECLMVSH